MAKKDSVAKKVTISVLEKQGIQYKDWIKEKRETVALALLRNSTNTYKELLDECICEEYASEYLEGVKNKNKPHYEPKTNDNKKEEHE